MKMNKQITLLTALFMACAAHAAFTTNNLIDGAQLKGGVDTNVPLSSTTITVKNAGSVAGDISNGGLRIGMIKADISSITGTVYNASLNLHKKDPVPHDYYIWTVDPGAPFQDWTGDTNGNATMESVLTNGMFAAGYDLWKANDANLNLFAVRHFSGLGSTSTYEWNSFATFKGKDLATLINNARAAGSNTLTFVCATAQSVDSLAIRGPANGSSVPYLRYSYDPADVDSLKENVFQIGGQSVHRNIGWSSATALSPYQAVLSFTNSVDTNLIITVHVEAGNTSDVLKLEAQQIGVDSSARQADSATNRLSNDETVTLTVSYQDPNGTMLDLGISGVGPMFGGGITETTTVAVASSTYNFVASPDEAFYQGTWRATGLGDLTKDHAGTWALTWSATGTNTQSGVGAFALRYLTGSMGPAYGPVGLNPVWSNSAGLELLTQSSNHVSASFTNTVDGNNRRFFQRVSDAKFTSAPVQIGETVTTSFTAKIGNGKPVNGGDRILRGSIWDEGSTNANALSFRVDYGAVSGVTTELGLGSVSSAGFIGNLSGSVSSTNVPTHALVNQGDASDFVLTVKRTGLSSADVSLSYDDVTVSKSYSPVNFDSFDAIGFRLEFNGENHLIITNLLVKITGAAAPVNPNPTNLTYTVSGNVLNFSWPSSHIGWTLQWQTNSRAIGLSNNWNDVVGSATTNQVVVTNSPLTPASFYRLHYMLP